MFSKTRTNGMYSNSAARARGARVQSPKREEIPVQKHKFCAETLNRHLLIFIKKSEACDNVICVTNIFQIP